MYTINSSEKRNPIQQLFPTTMWLDWLDVEQDELDKLVAWAKTQSWDNVGDTYTYMTRKGDQLMPEKPLWEYDNAPTMHKLMPQVQDAADQWIRAYANQKHIKATPGFANFVFYDQGGHQWPHWHNCAWTGILGLRNNGIVLLQDPRPIATAQGHMLLKEIIVNPGQLLITPGYLIHSSAYAEQERDILVFMGD